MPTPSLHLPVFQLCDRVAAWLVAFLALLTMRALLAFMTMLSVLTLLLLPIAGCTDSGASNYRNLANVDDGSCTYSGCLNSNAFNFDPSATVAGVCIDKVFGCMDPIAFSYRVGANLQGGVECHYTGCMDSTRVNYDPTANRDSGLCTPTFEGCTDSGAVNFVRYPPLELPCTSLFHGHRHSSSMESPLPTHRLRTSTSPQLYS